MPGDGQGATTRVRAERLGSVPLGLLDDPRLSRLSGWGERFDRLGISPGASGNLSVRSDRGFIISRTEVELPRIGHDDWVEVTGMAREPDGSLTVEYYGDHVPSRDSFVHGTVYGRQAGAHAIFHLHDQAMLNAAPDLGIPSTEEFFPAGTDGSVREIEKFVDSHPGVQYFVLVRHGIVAWAGDLDTAGALVEAQHQSAMVMDD
jgi:ribulose-5-phosphate 4-epimerase/fuculose-1-phosphate aldolase